MRLTELAKCHASLLCWASVSLSLCACSSSEKGELVVVITTDMVLPTDLNWLDMTVSRAGRPDEHKSIELPAFDSLPGTLAVVAGAQEAELVTITLEARSGGENGDVRVRREARLELPRTGQKMLPMPLNWLCSDANQPPEGCGAGKTCDAGQCVDSLIEHELTNYAPLKPAECFHTAACSLTGDKWAQAIPNIDPDNGDCIIDPQSVQPTMMATTVSLVLEPGLAGAAGDCVPDASDADLTLNRRAGKCFLPINQEATPNGWQYVKKSATQTEIRLPRGVCDAVSRCSVQRVVLTFNSNCPAKTSSASLCDAPPVCVTSPMSCPSTFPDSWTGYSCSGSASPGESYGDQNHYCGVPSSETLAGEALQCANTLPLSRGHFCCTAGQEQRKDSLLIDDMTDGPLIKLPVPAVVGATDGGKAYRNENPLFPGSWFTATDDPEQTQSQGQNRLFTYRAIEPVTPPDGTPKFDHAACFTMAKAFKGFYALEGFSFFANKTTSTAEPVDVSHYAGMTFWAKAVALDPDRGRPPIGVFFPNADTDTEHSSTCVKSGTANHLGKRNCNSYRQILPLNEQWQQFSVRWSDLAQAPEYGDHYDSFNPHVYSVDFEALGVDPAGQGTAPPFDFCVSQIRFLELPAP